MVLFVDVVIAIVAVDVDSECIGTYPQFPYSTTFLISHRWNQRNFLPSFLPPWPHVI